MSRTNFKMILAGLCMVLATGATASAQISQMRLFSPYADDQFGGGAYANQGFFGSIGAGMVSISQPTDQLIGTTKANTLSVYNTFPTATNSAASAVLSSTIVGNQINTSNLHAEWESATEFEVGNIVGHHGWSVKGTVNSPHATSWTGMGAGIALEDPEVMSISTDANPQNTYYVWNQGATPALTKVAQGQTLKIGRLWAVIGNFSSNSDTSYEADTNDTTGDDGDTAGTSWVLARIPITYRTYTIDTKINTWSVEAMYTYRFHPLRIGMFEFLGGVRYTTFDEKFRFMGAASTKLVNDYTTTHVQVLTSSSTSQSTSSAVTSDSENYETYDENQLSSIGSDFGLSDWNFEAQNHIVGPQIGGRYTLSNNRWRFIAESKFFAGFNRQNIYGFGNLGLNMAADGGSSSGSGSSDNSSTSSSSTNTTNLGGISSYTPIGTVTNSFAYSKHFNQFSPGVETKVEAAWNWTQAVSFKVGYQMLWIDDLARASAVNNYALNTDGTVFGVKENKDDRNFGTFVHGVMFTAQVNH